MKMLATLAVMLLAAFATYLWRGLPEVSRLEHARREMLERHGRLIDMQRSIDTVSYAEHAALVARRDELLATVSQRRAVLSDDALAPPAPTFQESLDVHGLAEHPLAGTLARQAAASPEADRALGLLLARLAAWPGLTLEELTVQDPAPLGGRTGLSEVRAEVVLTGALTDLVACLEALVPERGAGLPAPSVLSASLRRIPPDRWTLASAQLTGAPARLSASLSILFPSPGGGRP
jgi:hypothetical protein